MITQPMMKKLSAAIGIALISGTLNTVFADGTETLGTPSFGIQSGSGIVAAGIGLISQPGTININVPGTVKQALLYWEGQSMKTAASPSVTGDSTIVVNGITINGVEIGGPTRFFGISGGDVYSSTYRADITKYVGTGNNALQITGLDFSYANNGAGVMVIFDDGTSANIELRDGNDLAFVNFAPPLDTTVPQTFNFPADTSSRNADLTMFFSSVAGGVSGGTDRPTAIEVTINGVKQVFNNLLSSNNGDEWDTIVIPIVIPAGATTLTVQAKSVNNLGTAAKPASFAWNAAGLSIEEFDEYGQGCTPGYWKQEQHFDSWPLPYTPFTAFSNVFENAFPGKTLLQVLQQGGGGLNALGRHTVAALLNAASNGVSFDLTVSDVIAKFNSVYPGNNYKYEKLKNKLADLNEQGCPLN